MSNEVKTWPILMGLPTAKALRLGIKTETRRTSEPKFKVGDLLYVKETAAIGPGNTIFYRADYQDREEGEELFSTYNIKRWTPSLFMKREQSRFLLPVKKIASEPVQDITPFGAMAEGVMAYGAWDDYTQCNTWVNYLTNGVVDTPVESYRTLWEKIYAGTQWQWKNNPNIWVIKFDLTVNPELRYGGICRQCERYKGKYMIDPLNEELHNKKYFTCLCDDCAKESANGI